MATGLTSDVKIYIIKDNDLETTTGSTGTFAHSAQKAQRKKVQAKLDSAKYIFLKIIFKITIQQNKPFDFDPSIY